MQQYIDAHCHLQNWSDMTSVMQTARNVGLKGFICNATRPEDWKMILDIKNKYKNIYGCVGVHPWYVKDLKTCWASEMYEILKKNSDLMVGEAGLDKLHPFIELQEAILIEQFKMAQELNRSIHIHCVGAWDRLLKILKRFRTIQPKKILLHGFSASVEILEQLIKYDGIYFSFSDAVLNDRRGRFPIIINQVPMNKILVESDDKPPVVVIDVIHKISDIKTMMSDKIADIIYKNSLEFLKNG